MPIVALPDGQQVEFPDDTPRETMEGAIKSYMASKAPAPSLGQRAGRDAVQAAQGFNESLAGTVGFLPDMVGAGLRAVGLPSSSPGFYTDLARRGLQTITGAPTPATNTEEKAFYGAGKGAGDAAAIALPAGMVAGGAKAGSVLKGVAEALAAQPATQIATGAASGAVGEATDSKGAALATALLTPGVISAAGRVLQPVRASLAPEMQRLASVADAEGIPLTAGQRTGSKPLRYLESAFDTLPLTSGPQAALRNEQAAAYNQAVGSRAGMAATELTPDTVAANSQRLGGVFSRISNATSVNLDNKFLDDLQGTISQYANKLPSQQKPAFQAYVNDILSHGDAMPGTVYQTARSDLTRQAKATLNSDPTFSRALRGLRDSLDDAFGRSVPADMRDELATARRQYASQKIIEKVMSGAGEAAATGNVPPAQLRTAVASGNAGAYSRGEGDLNDLARVGQAFLKPMPDSGTAPRSYMQGLLTGSIPLGAGSSAMMAGASPVGAALAGAASLAGPRAVQSVYNLPAVQSYLVNGIPGTARLAGRTPQVNKALVAALLGARAKDAISDMVAPRAIGASR